MRQLSKMEQQTGIFTMRCTLSIEDNTVSIVDGQSGVSLYFPSPLCPSQPGVIIVVTCFKLSN